jgi:tetratricopeptide (TPR) repeat protein
MRSRWPNVNSIRRDETIARNRLGGLHARRGEHEAALGQYQQSLQLREARLKDEPEGNTEQRDVMNSRRYVAQSLIKLDRIDAALGTYADSILPMARSLREQNRNADGSTDQRAVRDLALVLREYGDVLVVVARHGEAVAPLVESFGLWEGLADATPDDLDLAWDAGRAGGSLAAVHVSMDQILDARIVLDRVQRRLDRGFRKAPDHARLKQVQAYCDSLRGAL